MAKFIFLMSDGKNVEATYTKPASLKIGKNYWEERGFSHEIGGAITIYTDEIWVGTLGVYDTSKPKQLVQMIADTREHVLALTERRIGDKLHELFGQKASLNAGAYRISSDQRNHKWTSSGRRLFNIEEILKGVCFRNE